MSFLRRAVIRLLIDDAGQDLVEYALLTGIITVAGALLFPIIADAMADAYTGWEAAAQEAWEPCPPAPASCP